MFKKILTTAAVLCAFIAGPAYAQSTMTLKTKDGHNVKVTACTDRIIRVQIAQGEIPESLMDRYGILKQDWGKVDAKVKGTTLTTASHTVTLDKAKNILTAKDKDGRVITSMAFLPSDHPFITKEAKVINDKFGNIHVVSNGGIIGDDDGSISEKDKEESGDPAKASVLSFRLDKNERFYGGGSTSREHIQHRGELLRMHTTYQQTEIPYPFMMSSKGWGVFNNTTFKNFWDCGATVKDELNIYNPHQNADFFIFLGETMPDVLNMFTETTGRTYILPKWAYGFCFGPHMREDQWEILNDAANFRLYDVPCDLLWLEPQWMEKRYDFSTEKKWNSQTFSPEPYWLANEKEKRYHSRLFVGKLKSMGFHLGLWLCEEYDLSITEEDQVAEKTGGKLSGEEHWMDHLRQFMNMGVEGFKLDPARTIDEHTYRKYYNGRTDREMHNLNQVLLPKQMRNVGMDHLGKRTWHHYCAGWAGTQAYGASTSGDNGGGRTALYDQLNLGLSGFYNTSCDVMSVPRELEMPGLHFGIFLPWIQVNSWFSMMHPWYYGEQEQDIYRKYIKFRYEIMPYIYSCALEAYQNGKPIVRAMPLVFPEDRNCYDMTYQYMFGPYYCVGIFTNEIYLPAGTWTDAWTGRKYESKGETFTVEYPEDRAGLLFVKEGAIIPCMTDRVKFVGTDPIRNFTIKVYPKGESTYTMYDCDAENYEHMNGAIAATRFDCKENKGIVAFTVNPVQGTFKDMPESRNYCFEIQLDSKPSSVYVNGTAVSDWTYDGVSVRLSVKDVKNADKCVICVK